MELFDVYDKQRNIICKGREKGAPLAEGEYKLVVHVCVFNSKGEMLIQQRKADKKLWPNCWDFSVGGHVISGETSAQAAERETMEELGIKVDLLNDRPHLTINFEQGFDDIYVVNYDIDIKDVKMQQEEVQNVRWANKQEVLKLLDDGEFIPYHKGFADYLFDANTSRGLHKLKL